MDDKKTTVHTIDITTWEIQEHESSDIDMSQFDWLPSPPETFKEVTLDELAEILWIEE